MGKGLNNTIPTLLKAEEKMSDSRPEKRTFIVLLLLTCMGMIGVAVILYLIPYIGFANIHPWLPLIMAVVFLFIVLFMIGGALTLTFTIIRGKNLFFNRRIRGVVIRLLYPLLILTGKMIGVGKDQVRRAFVAMNNQLTLSEARKVAPERLLILLPHCLQNHECKVRITGDALNCQACGKCRIKGLAALSRKYDVPLAVATGGTLARRIVVQKRPDVIIAVACERDLTDGIHDSYPIPVYGILNKRPFGPCFDTDVDLDRVERAIMNFLENEKTGTEG